MTDTTVHEVVLRHLSTPTELHVTEGTRGAPAVGQAMIRVEATGISFAERSMRRGRYPGQPAFPFVPGYDLVGTVLGVGAAADDDLVGQRVAVATKTGGWATHAVVDVHDVVPVPDGVEAADAETMIVNGITAWQMLHRSARVRRGGTVLVHGASGGVGTVLVQLATHAGIRVIGTAAPRNHDALRQLGVEPVDYATPDLVGAVRALAPDGVDAVFDHVGIESMRRSWSLLARGGALVAYGTATELESDRSVASVFAELIGRIALWTVLPNGRRASFYDFWGGKRLRPAAFRKRQHQDLAAVLGLLAEGAIVPAVAARFPLEEISSAVELAESGTIRGKVVLVP
ncbi:medium chain dehydrogenase/reductase family protein [Curtobacterium sp. Leaf261]|uniref:medium chain dehydrogenase/reductase family protein n=1 Tax=Curtobacterium sp. Leaf261 TaxID=1736311 RepID=UPI0006F8A214|nr:medium chain dehydrogenase/reductase family protein [Curtobacterium sp. Leaf261]KQO64416.1 NADPH:quinone reductase [Curtobacterium sp. Leaf261]